MASFTDDFNRANSTDLGANWVEVSGDWSIVSNQLSPGAAGGTIILRAATAMDSTDHYAQVTIAATTAASQGVWCRGNANISNGYLWRNNGSSWDLFSVVGGSFTVIGTYAAAATPGDVAKVQAVGTTIKGYVNGIERVSTTNTAVTTGTSVGIRSDSTSGLRYDDFAAADITAGATLALAGAIEAAQPLTGGKAAPLGTPAAIEAAQNLTGAKAAPLDAALDVAVAQPLSGAKTAVLPVAICVETAQPLTAVKSRSLGTADSAETARPLAGAKTAALSPAAETDGARALATGGLDVDADITVGAPYSAPYTAGTPHPGRWEVGTPW